MEKLKRYITKVLLSLAVLLSAGCVEEDYELSPTGNFDALWSIIDSRYCFFEQKGVDWQKVYSTYRPLVTENTKQHDLFDIMANMLAELKDGHVNLTSNFNQARYWKWFEDYPDNFYRDVVDKYYLCEPDYKIATGMRYRILEDKNIGYIYYEDFSSIVGENSLNEILYYFRNCDGIIIDVRDNGGGYITNINTLLARFVTTDLITGYIRHKLSPAHNDFSDYYPIKVEAADENRIKYFGKIAVLTNRRCYSATNMFVSAMKQLPNAIIIGDKTGGGSGLPFSSELPNGWSVRFSSSPICNAEKENIEFGIEPDINVQLAPISATTTTDEIIDRAIEWVETGN